MRSRRDAIKEEEGGGEDDREWWAEKAGSSLEGRRKELGCDGGSGAACDVASEG